MNKEELIESIDFKFYALTAGCYLYSDGENMAVCHRCDKEYPMVIDPEGEDFYVRYVQGELAPFINLISDIRYIIFERLNDIGNYRMYDFYNIKRKINAGVSLSL